MPDERFEEHLRHPVGRGRVPAHDGVAGGAICGDLVRIGVAVDGERVCDAGFEAAGCGAAQAAASAAVELVLETTVFEAARVGADDVAAALGGLSPGKLHAAELAADALARALGAAVAAQGAAAPDPERTLVAMSGGVDSAVAALRAGGAAAAVTLELWRDPDNDAERSCCSASAVRGARAVAHGMGLAHFTLDLRDGFRAGVVEPWLADHAAGLTPNPCVRCNGNVRLDAMLAFADRVGAATLTTGHYARRTPEGLLRLAADPAKDQAYVLAGLSRPTLQRMRFPLGDLTKAQVRAIAAEHELPVASKPDSQDLCFLAGTGRAAFLARHGGLGERPGDIVDAGGRVLGRHRGAHHFTVGQRRGLEVGGVPEPLYVLGTDPHANTVTVGPRAALATCAVRVRDARLHAPAAAVEAVKLRYRAPAVACTLDGDTIALREPVDGAAPGQTAVFLRGDAVLGCATIAG
ncbi:MAG TPA: tRNA 2-thiouridine(34) synthase MnmA [Solirubrobacteraceae bacterium]